MRWKAVLIGLVCLLAGMAGCKEDCFLTEADLNHYQTLGLPPKVETDPAASMVAPTADVPPPRTVRNPEQRVRYLSLAEAVAIALEQGTVGSPLLNGTTNDSLASLQGRSVISPESPIRVLALEPAIAATDIEASLAKFDARWNTSMTWRRVDEPLGGNILDSFQNGDQDQLSTGILKPLPTGGVAGITFTNMYTLLSSPPAGIVNPSYRPSLQFSFEQPLLQGFGVEINQLRSTHPGSVLTPFNTGGRVEGILITRLRFDQERAEFERQVATALVNVEVAYWNLYGAYWNMYNRDEVLRRAFLVWRHIEARAARVGIAHKDQLDQARGQYEQFRAQRLDAVNGVLESEHQLRGLLGLPIEDGTRLVPLDTPTLTPYQPEWYTSLNEALALRPELVLARQDLKFRQLDLINQKNGLLPDVRFTSTYDINGLGSQLDGAGEDTNALRNFAANQFHNWSFGLRGEIPIGYRDAHAAVRAARLRLAQSYAALRDQERRARRFLAEQYRTLLISYEQIQPQRAQREAYASQYNILYKRITSGLEEGDPVAQETALLDALRFYSEALRSEYLAVVQYNNTLALFEFAKGTMLQNDNVIISDGPLPHCAQVRAVEHERQRSKAILLRERAEVANRSGCSSKTCLCYGLPELPASLAPPVPVLFENDSPLPPDADNLPASIPDDTTTSQLGKPAGMAASSPAGRPATAAAAQPIDVVWKPAGRAGKQPTLLPNPAGNSSSPSLPALAQTPYHVHPLAAETSGGDASPSSGLAGKEAARSAYGLMLKPSPTTPPQAGAGSRLGNEFILRKPAQDRTPAKGPVSEKTSATLNGPGSQQNADLPVPESQDHGLGNGALATMRSALLPSEREAAVESLAAGGGLADRRVVEAVVQAACADPAATVRATCARCLARTQVDRDKATQALLRLQSDANLLVCQEAAKALAMLTKADQTR